MAGRIFVIIIAALFLGYSGYWYYQSMEADKIIEEAVAEFNQQGKSKHGFAMSLSHGDVETGGFPLHIEKTLRDVTIEYSITDKSAQPELLAMDARYVFPYLGVKWSLLDPGAYEGVLPQEVLIEGGSDDQKISQTFRSNSAPNLSVRLSSDHKNLRALHYSDDGNQFIDNQTQKAIYEMEPSNVELTIEPQSERRIAFDMDLEIGKSVIHDLNVYDVYYSQSGLDLKPLAAHIQKLGPVGMMMEIDYEGPAFEKNQSPEQALQNEPFNLKIESTTTSDLFDFSIDGDVAKGEGEPMPKGNVTLGLTNYKEAIRFFTGYWKAIGDIAHAAQAKDPSLESIPPGMFDIPEEMITKTIGFLDMIRDQDTGPEDLTITVKHLAEGQFMIGEMPFGQVMMMAMQTFAPPPPPSAIPPMPEEEMGGEDITIE